MQHVQPKKSLGQHFLRDENIARKIVNSIPEEATNILEIGPGEGILSKYIYAQDHRNAYYIDTDKEIADFLIHTYPEMSSRIIVGDFLKYDIGQLFEDKYSLVGNLPYNISSQIFFKALEHRDKLEYMVFMIQKEVAERIASPPGNKKYGILSVLLQAFFSIEYLFTVNEGVFYPPPRVKSAMIRLTRNETARLNCNEKLFFQVVKAGFNQRRKTLRNALKPLGRDLSGLPATLLGKRAEQLHVEDFVMIAGSL